MSAMCFLLSGGETIVAKRILLYPKAELLAVGRLRAEAQSKMGGASSGIGFWGSPEWAIGGAVVLGIIEGMLTDAKRNEGISLYVNAERLLKDAQSAGLYIDVENIRNAHQPYPNLWEGIMLATRRVDVRSMSAYDRNILRAGAETFSISSDGFADISGPIEYAYDGGEFILAETGRGYEAIRWSLVSGYRIE